MKKYAKIENQETKAVSVGLGTNTEFYKSLGMNELDVEKGKDGRWYLTGYAPQPSIVEVKETKLNEINAACDAAIEEKGKEYPQTERLTFDLQLYEATKYKADNTTETPILSVLAEKRGIELTDLVDRVIAKADEVRAYSASAIGQRQAYKDQVDAATTIEEVNAIEVNIVI